ncbi:hypothetical protein CBW46_000705 [Paenibacillus xerothermodurans]|uniref:ABC1 atypical kinase-like domain-containing protein n=1 Tax=Paenibacillus xerothermodurans TaxID=1977292 RepID=A0A2W1NEI1_PAEXE|nr:hypothetical protein CBW46_000705 [Paenibacillus xerothermodurans]
MPLLSPGTALAGSTLLEQELHTPVNELLTEFNDQPLAAASIGQVHFGRLSTGEAVAIKIQRPPRRGHSQAGSRHFSRFGRTRGAPRRVGGAVPPARDGCGIFRVLAARTGLYVGR